MSFSNILSLLGGLGCFLFGMKYMGEGLEQTAGPKMKVLMEKLTRNPIRGFLLGVLVTAVIQSSSATTVMVMGFINAGIMDLAQATGVIIGSNIGTTVTSILIALDISGIAPACIFTGALLMLYGKKPSLKHVGQIILGFGILFQGLHTMSSAMSALKDVPAFRAFITSSTNPVLGVLIGVLMCAIMQSSSASVGVLQALAYQSLMPIHFASYLICGINIGSALPPFLAAIGARNNAKRAAWIYLIYNVAGAILFIPITLLTPYTSWLESLTALPMVQVSLCHIIFKVVTAVILLPFTNAIVNLSYRFVPKVEHESERRLVYIDTGLIGTPSVAVAQVNREIERMYLLVKENLTLSMEGIISTDTTSNARIQENDEVVNYLNENITNYLVRLTALALPDTISQTVGQMFHVVNDFERIGDHLVALSRKTQIFEEKHLDYSEAAREELREIYRHVDFVYNCSASAFLQGRLSMEDSLALSRAKHQINDLTVQAQDNHIVRLQNGDCDTEPGIIYSKALHDLGRVGDYCINIAFASAGNSAAHRPSKASS